jgi:hypothetical protein
LATSRFAYAVIGTSPPAAMIFKPRLARSAGHATPAGLSEGNAGKHSLKGLSGQRQLFRVLVDGRGWSHEAWVDGAVASLADQVFGRHPDRPDQ